MSVSLAALAALGSLAATGIGAVGSATANAQARERLEADRRDDQRYYRRERYNQARATNVVAGGTDAHLAAMQAQGAKIVSDTANGIAERSQAYKDRVGEAKRASERAYTQQMFGLDQQKAQTIANAAGQASKAMAGIAAAGGPTENPYGMFGLRQGDYEQMAQAAIDANTEASGQAQLENSLQETLDDLKKQGY